MNDYRWLIYALIAAVAAAFTGIFAKVGMRDIDPTIATTVRSVIMVVFLVAVSSAQGLWHHLPRIRGWAFWMIALSGIAGATSWLFGFKAYASPGGDVSRVAPIDKLSVPLAAILAVILLHERPSTKNWAGILLIAAGAYLASIPRAPAQGLNATPRAESPKEQTSGK